MPAPPLFEHQKATVQFLREQEKVFDGSDPGTGKTRSAIEAFAERRIRGGGAALVLAPKSLLDAAWQEDFSKFAPYIKTSVAYARNREAAFWAEADAFITNHDAVKWVARQPASFFNKFDTLIIDESGAFKHATSQRSKAAAKIVKYFTYRLLMNGTIAPNSITDAWHQMYLLDDGERLGGSFYKFRQAVCTPKQVGPAASMVKWEDKEGASDAVSKLMEDITIRHKFEDCLDIPANHEYSMPYKLSPKQRTAYDQMEHTKIAELVASSLSKGEVISAVNAASVTTKLLQIASGAVYDEDGNYHLVDGTRYETVLDLVDQRRHTVVFFLWKHQRDLLLAEARKRKLSHCLIDGSVSDTDRSRAVQLYQQGMYRVCFAHPQSAAHGLTLTRGTATIWASPTYNLEHYQQGLRRIYRAGQSNRTETIVLVARDTLEERVYEALQDKKVRMDELLTQLITEKGH